MELSRSHNRSSYIAHGSLFVEQGGKASAFIEVAILLQCT